MEICGSSDYSSPSSFATIAFGPYGDCVSCWVLLLFQCLLSADILSDHTQSSRWGDLEFGAATIPAPPPDRDCNGGWIHCSKVLSSVHSFSHFIGWDIIILYYGSDMQSGASRLESRRRLHAPRHTHTLSEFCSSKVSA